MATLAATVPRRLPPPHPHAATARSVSPVTAGSRRGAKSHNVGRSRRCERYHYMGASCPRTKSKWDLAAEGRGCALRRDARRQFPAVLWPARKDCGTTAPAGHRSSGQLFERSSANKLVFRVSKLSNGKDPLTAHQWAGQQSPVPAMAPEAFQIIE